MSLWAAGTTLGPYELLAPLGSGGMGEVWKARDTRVDRLVAIKRLKGDHLERFKREARAIAALNHPHICQLYDVGDDYLVMEFVDGAPLGRKLPVEEAVRLAIQIASALEEAHGRGIIHRDLKPANVLVTAKGIKLLDFGLAKMDDVTGDSTVSVSLTLPGVVIGTVAYMSPEQAQGLAIDARSDVFSFGAVLYEALSGRRPFRGETTLATLSSVVKDEPLPLEAAPALDRIVRRCLAKQAAERYQTMSELRAALEKVQLGGQEQPSIAVLPFANMSRDPDDEYFSDGLAEEIINLLAHVSGLKVIARTSAFAFKGQNTDIRQIAGTLGVTNVLEGSVRKAGNRIRVTAQLIAASDGTHLWSERYDRELEDVFAIQDEIAQAITSALQVRLAPNEPSWRKYTPNLRAYEAYLKGQHAFRKMTPEALLRGKEYMEQAAALDPGFAVAQVGRGGCMLGLAFVGASEGQMALPAARDLAKRGLSIDPASPEAHALLGVAAALYDYDWEQAGRSFQSALSSPHVSAEARGFYAYFYLGLTGRYNEGIAELRQVLTADPLNLLMRESLAECLLALGLHEEAEAECRWMLEVDESFWLAHFVLSISQFARGLVAPALETAERCHKCAPVPAATGLLAGLLEKAGDPQRAAALLRGLGDGAGYGAPAGFSIYHLVLGDKARAEEWIARASEQHHPDAVFHPSYYFRFFRCGPPSPALTARFRLQGAAL